MRTALAEETLEVAFMLLCFYELGATVPLMKVTWARETLGVKFSSELR